MKKILFIIAFGVLIININIYAQNVVKLNEDSQIDLPIAIEPISHDQAYSHAQAKFLGSKSTLNSIAERKTTHIFRVDGILISLFTDNHATQEGHLAELKKTFDLLNIRVPIAMYNSKIQTINGNSVLIVKEKPENVVNYRFFVYNASRTRAITGILEFNSDEDQKATSLLNIILNGIKFTNN